MTAKQISGKEKWQGAHHDLQRALEKEIHLMREILASLHQEELALLEQDFKRFGEVMEARSDLVVEVRDQRNQRMDLTCALTKLGVEQQRSELLLPEEESSCTTLTKLDQLIALADRTNLQNCRNEALFEQARQQESLPLHCPFPHPLHAKKRRRPPVATKTRHQQ